MGLLSPTNPTHISESAEQLLHRAPEILRQLADLVRRQAGHDVHLSDQLNHVIGRQRLPKSERHLARQMYVNLSELLAHETGQLFAINRYDYDRLPNPRGRHEEDRRDHPASYSMRLDVWASRAHDVEDVANVIDVVARRLESEFNHPTKSRVGGRAYHAGMRVSLTEAEEET